jgi:murein DD-endopeptidase MepM/ murein hydrolase activator NlpD
VTAPPAPSPTLAAPPATTGAPATAETSATSAAQPAAAPTTPEAPSTAAAAPTTTAAQTPTAADAPAPTTETPAGTDVARLEVEGRPIQGGLLLATLHGKQRRVEFPGHRAVVGDDGRFLIGFSRNAKPTETLRITLADGKVIEHVFQVEQRTYETDRVDGLPEDEVKLDPATRAKVRQADARLDKVRRAHSKIDCYDDDFTWPLTGKITSRYGQPRILNGIDGGIHWGLDIAANVGTAVRAPACGKVVFAETDVPLSGNVIVIDHGRGLTSAFLHLHKISAKVNDEVKQGTVLGTVGQTGRASGPHLDWRMNLFDIRLDPELVLPAGK